jgi:hypothetical protein
MQPIPSELGVLLVGAVIVLGWIGSAALASHLTGWAALARDYRLTGEFPAQRWSFQSAAMRWYGHYGSCLTAGADTAGLYISVFALFRIAHPSLFVPWSEISATRTKILWSDMVELRLGRELRIPFRICEKLAGRLRAAAGRSWPTEAVA